MTTELNQFDFFSTRLCFIKATDDQLLNIDLWHYLGVFESHVYGIFLQYNRIKADLKLPRPDEYDRVLGLQAGLDIYYYTLTWDKLKKICDKIKDLVNRLQQVSPALPKPFISDFRHWKRRMHNLFSEFDAGIRNEYEHPSLESYTVGNIQMWGNIIIDGSGNIKAHVGNNWFAIIKKDHIEKIQELRADLFDFFMKHFSKKPLAEELIKAKNYIEDNIDTLIEELAGLKEQKNWEGFNSLFYQLTMYNVYLSKEGINLSQNVQNRISSVLQL